MTALPVPPADLHERLRRVVDRLVHEYGPLERILLFGSAARGEADAASDLDLIVIKRTTDRFHQRILDVPVFEFPADVFVHTPEEFAEMREHENPFILSALEDAVELYPRPVPRPDNR